jgi:large subunit ribosomal protein L17
MRHHHDKRQLSRTAEHRRALLRALVTSLFEYERIETTVAKAKEARRVAERMITHAKKNSIHSRRLVARVVQNEDVAKKLFDTIAPWYATREGGYTRILKTRRRLGDAGEMALLELVKSEQQKEADRKARAEKAAAAAAAASDKKKGKGGAAGAAAGGAEPAEEKKPKSEKGPSEPKMSVPEKGKKGGLFGRLKRKGDTERSGDSGK